MKSSNCPILRALLSKRGGITVEAFPLILLLQLLQVFPEIKALKSYLEKKINTTTFQDSTAGICCRTPVDRSRKDIFAPLQSTTWSGK